MIPYNSSVVMAPGRLEGDRTLLLMLAKIEEKRFGELASESLVSNSNGLTFPVAIGSIPLSLLVSGGAECINERTNLCKIGGSSDR
ncbi:hypothetical protein VB714_22330 [Spirulina sp. 06S082]|nr:hypothetical protein [Spirulina sp. 06S082]